MTNAIAANKGSARTHKNAAPSTMSSTCSRVSYPLLRGGPVKLDRSDPWVWLTGRLTTVEKATCWGPS